MARRKVKAEKKAGLSVTQTEVAKKVKSLGEGGWTSLREKNGDGDYGYDEIISKNKVPIFRIHMPGCRAKPYIKVTAESGWDTVV